MPPGIRDGVPRATRTYEPRRAADSVLYQVVRDHYETFRAQAAALRDGEGLPRFIEKEFRGLLPRPSMQWVWAGPAGALLVQRPCGVSKSRRPPNGRRSEPGASRAVAPPASAGAAVGGRHQLPHRLRDALAWDHALCCAVVGVYMRAGLGRVWRRRSPRTRRDESAAEGAVAILQRVGAALNVERPRTIPGMYDGAMKNVDAGFASSIYRYQGPQ